MYDTIVVGGGIAGVTVAHELSRRGIQICILERYGVCGGRVLTHRDDSLQYEIGAGRIFHAHKHVAELVKRYKLHTYPITTKSQYAAFDATATEPNPFLDIFTPIRTRLASLESDALQTHTVADLIPKQMHPILKLYPYHAELHTLRADLALSQFTPSATMGVSSDSAYYGIVEGIDAITTHLANDVKRAGAVIHLRHRVTDIVRTSRGSIEISGMRGKKATAQPFVMHARRVVIATARPSYDSFSILRHAPFVKHLATSPLIRIYAVYPKNANNRVWFAGMQKLVTNNRLRYIIPINEESGLIMISYTDGADTTHWRKHADDLQAALRRELRLVFPHIDIPDPVYLQMHDWADGCTYWLPGKYDVHAMSQSAHNPSPNVYVCGEAISTTQAWMEGALESAMVCIDSIKNNTKN